MLDSFGHADNSSCKLMQKPRDLTKRFGWDSHHHRISLSYSPGKVSLESYSGRELDAWQVALVLPGALQFLQVLRVVSPKRDVLFTLMKQARQRGSPRARTQHSDLHEAR